MPRAKKLLGKIFCNDITNIWLIKAWMHSLEEFDWEPAFAGLLLYLMPNIQKLTITHCSNSFWNDDGNLGHESSLLNHLSLQTPSAQILFSSKDYLENTLLQMEAANSLPKLNRLTELRYAGKNFHWQWLESPTLRKLEILSEKPLLKMIGAPPLTESAVTSVTVDMCPYNLSEALRTQLSLLLRHLKKLRTLQIGIKVPAWNYGERHRTRTEPAPPKLYAFLADLAKDCVPNLKGLTLYHYTQTKGKQCKITMPRTFHDIRALRDIPTLRRLCLSEWVLTGVAPQSDAPPAPFDSLVPRHLEELRIQGIRCLLRIRNWLWGLVQNRELYPDCGL
ncbi:hypothetical protein BCR34DRAFT_554367 [Clohesyomyces aquaticus]|uniref:Uncharacterized protein n=1 Tax=Clohesyomyces aquaticus TaxID=1231657 RepID=A0A1Y2A788_9PLEO|nr:hypothetical protein BCR34DRAFT_554367 [Clohesyomyces aquaticus]